MLSGFVIRSSDKYIEGETIRLGDGTSGTILHMGALEMHIRGKTAVNQTALRAHLRLHHLLMYYL